MKKEKRSMQQWKQRLSSMYIYFLIQCPLWDLSYRSGCSNTQRLPGIAPNVINIWFGITVYHFLQSRGPLKFDNFPEWKKNQRFLCSGGNSLIGCNNFSFAHDYTWQMIQNGPLLCNSGSQTVKIAPLVRLRAILGVEWTTGGEYEVKFSWFNI